MNNIRWAWFFLAIVVKQWLYGNRYVKYTYGLLCNFSKMDACFDEVYVQKSVGSLLDSIQYNWSLQEFSIQYKNMGLK